MTKEQNITNSVAHEGHGLGLFISSSKYVTVANSSFIGGKSLGVVVLTSTDITLDGNFVSDVTRRLNEAIHMIDIEGAYAICSILAKNSCKDLTITNNIAAGSVFAGFVAPGHECGTEGTQTNFKGNVAHSIQGTGAHIYPDSSVPSHGSTCYAGSHFSAYKC
jgi:hypothetical protein